MESSISKEELLPTKSLEIINIEKCDDNEFTNNDDAKGIFKNHIFYDKCIRNGFYVVFVIIVFIIAFLIQILTSRINHFNRYFYDSCNVLGIISINDLLKVNSVIYETHKKLEIATQNVSSHEINETEITSLEKSWNESLELCAAQNSLRESCYIRELNIFAKTQNHIFKYIVLPYFSLLLFLMPTYFAFCCKKLLKFSVDDDDIDDTRHAKKVIKVFLFIMTIFAILLYVQFAPKNISTRDVPLICGSMTTKFLTKECYYESEGCYAFPKMSEYIPPGVCLQKFARQLSVSFKDSFCTRFQILAAFFLMCKKPARLLQTYARILQDYCNFKESCRILATLILACKYLFAASFLQLPVNPLQVTDVCLAEFASEHRAELYYMFWLYFFIAFSCFTFFAFYHGSKFQDYYNSR